MTDILEISKTWVDRGISVIPCGYMAKKPILKKWGMYQTQLPTQKELEIWFSGALRNYGVITGWRGLVVLDFDTLDFYWLWRDLYQVETSEVLTSRGIHVYLFVKQPVRTYHTDGIDIQSAGAYVLGPGSVHPTGAVYMALNDFPIVQVEKLEDVLPAGFVASMPTRSEQIAQPIIKPVNLAAQSAGFPFDPWAAAMKPPSQNLIQTIREKIDILSFFPNAHKTGDNWYIAHCPLHDDRTPSLWIDARRGLCGCYAGCNGGKSLDVINLYAKTHNLTNSGAIDALRKLI